MLHGYAFSNFQSFRERTEVSFRLDKKVPPVVWAIESASGIRVSKVMGVIGPNASGKTALLKPLAFLAWFISHSFDAEPDAPIPFHPHFSSGNEPSEFEVEVEFGGKLWRYELTVTRERVLREALFAKHDRFKYVFVREWKSAEDQYIVKQQDFGFAPTEARKARRNASLLSTASQYGVPFATNVGKAKVMSNINVDGRVSLNPSRVANAANFFASNEPLRSNMSRLLSSWDLGLSDVELREITVAAADGSVRKSLRPFGLHHSRGKKHSIDFKHESSGTQGAFVLLAQLLPALESGGLAVIDEFENDLHPHMLAEILDLFANPTSNPRNAQLIFNCHAIEVLNVLHKSQVMLVEKDEDCESHAWRLDSVDGIRNDDNFYAKYMAGAYGAIPNL